MENNAGLVFIKKGEYGDKLMNFEKSIHKQLITELCREKQNTPSLSKNTGISEIDIRRQLEFLEKTKILKYINGKWSLDFICLDEERTTFLTKELDKYTDLMIPFIKENVQRLEKNIKFENMEWNEIFPLFCLICTDVVINEMCFKIKEEYQSKKVYDKKWSIVAYTQKDEQGIFRNDVRNFSLNAQGRETALFTYGDGKIEKFNREIYENAGILKFNAEEYASFIYSLNDMIEKLSDDSLKKIIKRMEKEVDYYFKNQLSYVVENRLPFIRYKMLESIGITEHCKRQFIIRF